MNHAEPVAENYEITCCVPSVENLLKRNVSRAIMLLYYNLINTA